MNRLMIAASVATTIAVANFAVNVEAQSRDIMKDDNPAATQLSAGEVRDGAGERRDINRDMDRNLDRDDRQMLSRRETGDRRETQRDPQTVLRESSEVYRAIAKGPHGNVPDTITSKAQCVAIIPNIITAAAVVGGSHGNGVAHCKTSAGKWSDPLFVDLTTGSLGAQLGAKSTDLVLYFTNPAAVSALKRGKFALGADASVVAGNFDRTFDTSGAGVVAYQRASGAFLGAAINGGTLSADNDDNREYYGKEVTSADILEGRQMATGGKTNPLSGLLP